ncbi:hypothetical protein E4U55_001330 [Claviceps digitariae]|nr:hypothetical protein E4U55_001330 [Claviceps digitariae]
MDGPLTAALLIVSTTAAEDPATDSSASVLRAVFAEDGGDRWNVVAESIVADDVRAIQKQVMQWADGPGAPNLIVTTGGTGFAVMDGTPEAIIPLLHKQASGLVHAMLSASLAITPFAMMSRPAAGVRHKSLIVTLPGSPKGARENLQAIIKTLPHACLQACGANSRALHAGGVRKLEADAGIGSSQGQDEGERAHGHDDRSHNHHHHHHHRDGHGHSHAHGNLVRHSTTPSSKALSNDPSLGPTRRHRESPYPMISVDRALALISQHTPSPEIDTCPVDDRLINCVLAEDVTAQENVPAFRASIVDGYAVVAPPDGKLEGIFPVTAISHAAAAGASSHDQPSLKDGEVARITTGAPLPPGATSVIMVEDTILKSTTEDGHEEKEVKIRIAHGVKPGDNIREVGSDIALGSLILRKGETISGIGGEIGLLAAGGLPTVQIYRKPLVGILSTGDELVPHNHPQAEPLRVGQVRDTNRITLLSAVRDAGFQALDLGIARDQSGSLEEMLRRGLRDTDVLITTGGVSMGELDLLKPTIERSLGGTIHFGRVAIKPGKPTTFATIPVKDPHGRRTSKLLFALPGNPASALVTFHVFVLPSLHKQSGTSHPETGLPKVPVLLAHDLAMDPHRQEYHRAVVTVRTDGVLTASSTGPQRSSKVGSLRAANALLCVPIGTGTLDKGSKVDALLMGAVRAG